MPSTIDEIEELEDLIEISKSFGLSTKGCKGADDIKAKLCKYLQGLEAYLPTLPVFTGVSKFFIKSPGLPVRAPNLPGNTYRGFFQFFFFVNLVVFEMSKRIRIGGRQALNSSTSSSGNSRIHDVIIYIITSNATVA